MDPNATWNEMVSVAENMERQGEEEECIDTGDACRLAELTLALSRHLSSGGAAPDAFKVK